MAFVQWGTNSNLPVPEEVGTDAFNPTHLSMGRGNCSLLELCFLKSVGSKGRYTPLFFRSHLFLMLLFFVSQFLLVNLS